MYAADDYRTAISLIASGKVDTGEIVTATFPLEEGGQSLREIRELRT